MRIAGLGGFEWLIILLVVIMIFGTGRLAGIGPALGKSIRGFREEVKGQDSNKQAETKQEAPAHASAAKSDGSK